jgi:hypothetical protein
MVVSKKPSRCKEGFAVGIGVENLTPPLIYFSTKTIKNFVYRTLPGDIDYLIKLPVIIGYSRSFFMVF